MKGMSRRSRSVTDSTHCINKTTCVQEILMSTISLKKFLTVVTDPFCRLSAKMNFQMEFQVIPIIFLFIS
jgi:hypothetical protein